MNNGARKENASINTQSVQNSRVVPGKRKSAQTDTRLNLNLTAGRNISRGEKFGLTLAQLTPGEWQSIVEPGSPITVEVKTAIPDEVESAVGITVEDLAALYALDSLKGLGPQTCKELFERGIHLPEVVRNPSKFTLSGKRASQVLVQLEKLTAQDLANFRGRAIRQLLTAHKLKSSILTYAHPAYPRNLYESNYPVPILYSRGSVDVLGHSKIVACVGSRKIRGPYNRLHAEFVKVACSMDFTIVSGFALGADSIGHETAGEVGGRTICVMPGGLDRPFPPENGRLWLQLLSHHGAVFVTESAFGARAGALTLRKRNKLIVAFALGVLLSQSSQSGGAMNAYRFALEQRKPLATFADDGQEDTSGNRYIADGGSAPRNRTNRTRVFPMEVNREAYGEWLRELSSSI